MALFEVIDVEGASFVKITLDNETVRAERSAICSGTSRSLHLFHPSAVR